MTIRAKAAEIKNMIDHGRPFEEYQPLFFRYIGLLEKLLLREPKKIRAICQLAIAKMRLHRYII